VELGGQGKQNDDSVAPAIVEYVPDAQLVHASAPVVLLYVPAAQIVHVSPFAPEYPALQVQSVAAELCAGESEFAGQVLRVPPVHHVPAAHSTHTVLDSYHE